MNGSLILEEVIREHKDKRLPLYIAFLDAKSAFDVVCHNSLMRKLFHIRCLFVFVLRFYGPVNPMGSCRARSVYLTTRLLGRLSPLSG